VCVCPALLATAAAVAADAEDMCVPSLPWTNMAIAFGT